MSGPVISIITASFHAADTLQICLDSVCRQTYQNIEHIVIDGGSKDSTVSILEAADVLKLRWISEPDRGIAEAMNKGIRMARGEWLLFLHADDQLLSADSLQIAARTLPKEPSIVSFVVEVNSKDGSRTRITNRGWCMKTNFKTSLGHQGALIHRDLFDTVGAYDEHFQIAMDYDWFMRAFRMGIPIHCHAEILSEMRDTGISSRADWDSLEHRFREERRVHLKNAPGVIWRAIYAVYWSIYPMYRKIRYKLSRSKTH